MMSTSGILGRLAPAVLSLCYLNVCQAANPNDTAPIAIFRSRPDLVAPILTPITHKSSQLAPGHYFVAPYMNEQEGIYIYDNDLNLVYTSFGSSGPGVIHNPHLCTYNSSPHLCFFQGVQMLGWAHGHGVIMNTHYQTVTSIQPSGSHQGSSDMHEFHLLPPPSSGDNNNSNNSQRALLTQYLRSVHDLCTPPWNICDGLAYVHSGAFQEIDVATGEAVFAWSSLDHVSLEESYVAPRSTEISGTGESPTSPWDYFHINSVDKNGEGDYLVSARHTSAVYKISGEDGRVLWRLNGARSDFRLEGFGFSFQHDARWVSDGEGESVITLFNNGGNGYNQTHPFSDGKVIRLDHRTRTARVVEKIAPPFVDGHAHYAKSQGNFQRLDNGGVVMGWGNDPFWTEYAPKREGDGDGEREVVFYGYLALRNMMNYRAQKFEGWVGRPLTKPALWGYSKMGNVDEGMMLYVSWNGATEVMEWLFYGAQERKGPYMKIGRVKKQGFETIWKAERFWNWTYAEALDEDGEVLGTSQKKETYVPGERLRKYCDELACRFVPTEEERQKEREMAEQAQNQAGGEEGGGWSRFIGQKKNQVLLGCLVGLTAVLLVITVLLCVDNRVGRTVRSYLRRLVRRGPEDQVAVDRGPEYKPLAPDEGDDT